MRLDTTLSQRMDQRMILAPRMIQSMEILQLPIMALQERIQQELEENPVLELKEDDPDQVKGDDEDETPSVTVSDDGNREPELVIDDKGQNEDDFSRLDAISKDWEDHFNEEHRPSRNSIDEEGDKKHDAMQNMASRPQSFHEYLTDQLAFLDLTPEQTKLAAFIIQHINEHGFLTTPVESLAQLYGQEVQEVTIAQVEEAVQILQKLDPPGVAARDVRECLLLQLTPETPYRDVLRVLIQNHLDDLNNNRLPIIQ